MKPTIIGIAPLRANTTLISATNLNHFKKNREVTFPLHPKTSSVKIVDKMLCGYPWRNLPIHLLDS